MIDNNTVRGQFFFLCTELKFPILYQHLNKIWKVLRVG